MLAVPCVYVGLWLTGTEFNITSNVGMTMIVGIVTEVAISIFRNFRTEAEGEPGNRRFVAAGINRMRPIAMTTFAAILRSSAAGVRHWPGLGDAAAARNCDQSPVSSCSCRLFLSCCPRSCGCLRVEKHGQFVFRPELSRPLEPQIPALAIPAEEEDGRRYADFAEHFAADFPRPPKLFDAMAQEESGHRHRLIELSRTKFGEHIPLIRREDVRGFYTRRPRLIGIGIRPERARAEAARMEIQSRNFYHHAAQLARDASIRQVAGRSRSRREQARGVGRRHQRAAGAGGPESAGT